MKFSKRVNFLLISFLLAINVAIRYPVISHEIGVDSFVIHILGNSITQNHYAKWILHPLSYIGLYPLSYPSAYPYLAAGVSTSCGMDVERSILAISVVLGLIGVFSTYFLAREIKNDDLFCFVAALAFTFSPIFLKMTFWQASTRNLFMSLSPACILLLLKTRGFSVNRMTFLFIILLFTVGTSHRLGVFMIFILIAYLTSVLLFAFYKQLVPILAKSRKTQFSLRILGPSIIVAIFIALLAMLFSGNNPLQGAEGLITYEETRLFSGSSPPILILNLFISLIGRIGIMLVFGLIGSLYLIWKKNKTLYDVFLIVSLIFLFPTIGMRTYSSAFFLVFFSLLAGFCFILLFRLLKKRRLIVLTLLMVSLVASVGFVGFMFDTWRMEDQSMPESTYDAALYMKYMTDSTFVANDGLLAARVGAISGNPCLPIGGGTLPANGPEQLIYGYLQQDDFEIIPIPIQKISVGSDALYQAKGAGDVERDWTKNIHWNNCDEVPRNLIIKYNLQYSLARKDLGNRIWAFSTTYHSRLLASLDYVRYRIYDNGALELHYFEYV
jgi:hypothetical protein